MSANQTIDSQTMPKVVADRFRSDDLELLETGLYSDAQVVAGDRVWDVHRSIVGQRSGYMRDELFGCTDEEVPAPKRLPFGTTETQAALLLEFLYSGSIATMDELSLEDCVELSVLGLDFRVDSMITYATVNLWDKLKSNLQPTPDLRKATSDQMTDMILYAHNKHSRGLSFESQFRYAVDKAYSHQVNACQLILADFVWAARSWLLGTSLLERLNIAHPKFSSHVLTTLNKGPQSSFVKRDGQLTSTFCTQCAEDQVDGPGRALQVFRRDRR